MSADDNELIDSPTDWVAKHIRDYVATQVTAIFPRYDTYQATSSRDLPMVILEAETVEVAGVEPAAGAS